MYAKETTLLERMHNPESGSQKTTKQNIELLKDSILNNLRRLLNTHQGNVPILPDYGLESIHSRPENMEKFQQTIRNAIKNYEPRLKNIKVNFVDKPEDPLRLHFEIKAQMSTAQEKASLYFETMVESSGRIQVKD